MKKILTQQDWDKLPVHTTATLTRLHKGVRHTIHVTRAAGDIQLKDDGYLLLGGPRWSKVFADADTAYALFIPAGRAIDVSELIALLDKHDRATPLEIACGHRRFRPDRLAENTGRKISDIDITLELSALDGQAAPADVGELLRFLWMGLDVGRSWGLQITQGTLLAAAADGLAWHITGVAEQDGTLVVTTNLVVDEPEDPAPRWTTVDEYIRRANETAVLRHDKRYRDDVPMGRVLQDIREAEESLEGLEASVKATEARMETAAADVLRRRQELAAVRYIVGVTDRLDSPEEEAAFDV